MSSYSEGDKNPNAGFVVIDKSSGELCYCPIDDMDMINPVSRIDDIREFLKNDTPPAKCYSAVADGASGTLSWLSAVSFVILSSLVGKMLTLGKGFVHSCTLMAQSIWLRLVKRLTYLK